MKCLNCWTTKCFEQKGSSAGSAKEIEWKQKEIEGVQERLLESGGVVRNWTCCSGGRVVTQIVCEFRRIGL